MSSDLGMKDPRCWDEAKWQSEWSKWSKDNDKWNPEKSEVENRYIDAGKACTNALGEVPKELFGDERCVRWLQKVKRAYLDLSKAGIELVKLYRRNSVQHYR